MKSPRGTTSSTERIIQSNDGLSIGRNNASHGTKNKLRLSSGGRTRANGVGNSGGLSKRDTRREGTRIMDAIGGLYFLFHVSRVRSEGPLLRLHVLTAALMLTFSVIVSAKQSVGNPIDCVHTRDIPVEAFNAYCWIHSTYIVTGAMLGVAGVNVAFPGVAPSFSFYQKQKSDQGDHGGRHRASANENPLIKHVKYYQWVAFCLIFQVQRASEDTFIFRLHYRVTVAFLLGGCLTLACKSISGSPIHCEGSGSVDKAVLETFCWLHTTYSLIHAFNMTVGQAVPYPGVTNSKNDLHGHGYHPLVKQHKYYQWVIFALLLQAILFYTPRWLWKGWEGGKIHALMMDLDIGLCSEVEKKQKKKMLLDYLWENLSFHNWWAYKYYICELLALINVVGQMFLMNRFFDGAFLTFGIDVLRFLESDQEDRVDPMIYVFPRMTKCTFYKYGVSGEVETHDAVCILPLNVVNEKIYVFLWFWFLALGVLSLLTVLYRVVIIFSPRTRVYLLRLRFHLVRRDAVETIVRRSKVGDWFLLYMLGENLDTVIYRDVMHELANKLATRHHHSLTGAKGELQEA